MYTRQLEKSIEKWISQREIIILYGARQVGKTTLTKGILERYQDTILINCENINVTTILESRDMSAIKTLFGPKRIIALDEAQSIRNIGIVLKIIYDELPQYKIIATGSSSFDLSNKLSEPLTGRNVKFWLPPLSLDEIRQKDGWLHALNNLKEIMVYGTYPGITTLDGWQKQKKIIELASDYLFKDLLAFENIKNSATLYKLLKALAFQVGSQVSVNELSNLTGLSRPMVDKYLDLLQKCFIIFRLESFSSNLRNEIKKSNKYYFHDNGMLNAITGNFNPLINRNDSGMLWENFVISEIMKQYNNHDIRAGFYFWRTYDGAEIDLIVESNQKVLAYECKWNPRKQGQLPESFRRKYNVQNLLTIHPENLHQLFEIKQP